MEKIKTFEEFVNENKTEKDYKFLLKTKDKNVLKFLKSLSKNDLDQFWIDYSKLSPATTYNNPLTIWMFMKLDEGLINTYPVDKVIEYVSNYFKFNIHQIYKKKAENDIYHIRVIIANRDNNFEIIKKAMRLCGYSLGAPKESEIHKYPVVELQFEPEHQTDESKKIRKEEKVLYHLTPMYNLGKIKHIGFSPRLRNELFSYPSRLYFLRGSVDENEILNLGKQLCKYNSSLGNDKKYALITLDLKKIPNDIKMFLDPNYLYGIFVTENISSDVIVDIKEVDFKKE